MRYKDREEIIKAGDAYYLEPGHCPLYEEDTEVVEFSSKEEYERTLAAVAQNAIDIENSAEVSRPQRPRPGEPERY